MLLWQNVSVQITITKGVITMDSVRIYANTFLKVAEIQI